MKPAPLLAASLLATLFALIQLPASLVGDLLASQCPERCRLAHTEGRLWAGQGELFLRAGPHAPWQAAGPLAWHWQWPAGWPGLKIDLGGGQIDARLNREGLQLDLHAIALPANTLLSQLGDKLPQSGWQGWLTLPQGQITLGWDARWHSQGEIHWRDARSRLLEDAPLGQWRFHWQRPANQPLQGQLTAQGGEVALQGQLNWPGPGQAMRFDGEAQSAVGGVAEKYLRAVGRVTGGCAGCYRLQWPR